MVLSPLLSAVAPLSPPQPRPSDFAVSVHFAADRTVVAVRGELDVLSAPAFGDFLDIAAARSGCLVVIDLAELTFIDASGLNRVARALVGLRKAGGDLAIASASPMTYKLLDLAGFTGMLDIHLAGRLTPRTARQETEVPAFAEVSAAGKRAVTTGPSEAA